MVVLRMLTLSPCAPRGGERLLVAVAESSQCGERRHKLVLELEKKYFIMLVLFETAAGYAIFKVSIFITLKNVYRDFFFQ